MPLRKEKPLPPPAAPPKESEIDAYINKGGSVAVGDRPKKAKQQNYPLYFLQRDMREHIDAARGRAGDIDFLKENAASLVITPKETPDPPAIPTEFENRQLGLFQEFLCNTDEERERFSN